MVLLLLFCNNLLSQETYFECRENHPRWGDEPESAGVFCLHTAETSPLFWLGHIM